MNGTVDGYDTGAGLSFRLVNTFLIVGLLAAVLAAALHVLIFWMESIAWEGPLARKTFGGTAEQARPHAFYAYNQGFYNLFLAVEALAGAVLMTLGSGAWRTAGTALALYGVGSMLAAALVLALKSPAHRTAALKQGAFPLIAVVFLAAGLLH
ncbi:putative membrane protein [Actinomyces ruminicola]|uniref:Putative membrane protein n=1 Tax=Actinomyces ruminicola TaxID=332524 RepID=A0A1H0F415_9ACTO|nr:putative membrane protein [Actinomyces ruminicola]